MQEVHKKLEPMFRNVPLEIVGGIVVIAFGTFIFTSNEAVPGEVSYLMDRGLEQIKYMITSDEDKIEFRLQQLRERVDEYEEIVIYERFGNESSALLELQLALNDLEKTFDHASEDQKSKLQIQVESVTRRVEGLIQHQAEQNSEIESNQSNQPQQDLQHYFLY